MTRKLLIRVNGTFTVKFIAGVWAPKSVDKVGSGLKSRCVGIYLTWVSRDEFGSLFWKADVHVLPG